MRPQDYETGWPHMARLEVIFIIDRNLNDP